MAGNGLVKISLFWPDGRMVVWRNRRAQLVVSGP